MLFAISLITVSYNLRAEKGLIGFIPFVQITIPILACLLFVKNKKEELLFSSFIEKKKNNVLFFSTFSVLFIVLVFSALLNSYVANRLYLDADFQLRNGQMDNAVLGFRRSIEKKPNLFAVYPKLCDILFKQEKFDDVINICEVGIPYLRMTTEYYVRFYFYIASSYFRKQKIGEALYYYDKLIKIHNENSLGKDFFNSKELYFLKGLIFARSKKWEKALGEYQKAYEIDKDNQLIKFKMAEACYFLGKDKEALLIFEDLINLGFNYKDLFLYLAQLYTKGKIYPKAIIEYEKYLAVDPGNKEVYLKSYVELGRIYEALDDHENAIASYKKLFLSSETEPQGHRNLGQLYLRLDSFDKAITEFRMLLANKNSVSEANFLIGEVYAKMGKNDTAFNYYMQTLKLGYASDSESYVQAIKRIGQYYRSKGSFDLALKNFKKLFMIRPAQMYYEIALAYIDDKGVLDKGLSVCDEGYNNAQAKTEPNVFTSIYAYLIEKYRKQRDIDKIIYISEKLLTFDPVFVPKWEQIGIDLIKLHLDKGHYEDAVRIYTKMLDYNILTQDAKDTLIKLLSDRK